MAGIIDRVLAEYRRKDWTVNTRPLELNIIGLRSTMRSGTSFDDEIHVFWVDATKKWRYLVCPASTDPSDAYLKNPVNGKYTSVLAEGQYRGAYQVGKHLGHYPALVQSGPVQIVQDYDRNAKFDARNGQKAMVGRGVDIVPLPAFDNRSNVLGHGSAACQILQSPADMATLLTLANRHVGLYGNQLDYALLDYRAASARRKLGLLAVAGGALAAAAAAFAPNWFVGDTETD